MTERETEEDKEVRGDTGKRKRVREREDEAFDIFSQGEIRSVIGVVSTQTVSRGTWSSALARNDICVLPSFEVEVVGVGELSDSGWEFGSGVLL